jgi:aldehyde dehydrogenase (NAD+)
MAIVEEENLVAAAAGVEQLVRDLQRTVRSGITKTEKWRIQQLKALLKLIVENQESLVQAVFTDLGKPAHQVVFTELLALATSCKFAIKELKKWMAPEEVPVPPIALPGTAFVVPEPLGVALVIAPWNFPLCKPKVCLLSQMAQFFCVSLSTLP